MERKLSMTVNKVNAKKQAETNGNQQSWPETHVKNAGYSRIKQTHEKPAATKGKEEKQHEILQNSGKY
jgi:hypothetical protein